MKTWTHASHVWCSAARMSVRRQNSGCAKYLTTRIGSSGSTCRQEHLQQVDARLQPVRDDAGRRVTLRFDGIS
jgi:hypothetical protein